MNGIRVEPASEVAKYYAYKSIYFKITERHGIKNITSGERVKINTEELCCWLREGWLKTKVEQKGREFRNEITWETSRKKAWWLAGYEARNDMG